MNEIKKVTGYFKSFDGTPIYYEVRGEGKPLIFVYGIVCQMNHWVNQIQYFSKSYQTILFDYRGHHQSGTPTNPANLSLEALARDIKGLCEHLDLPPCPMFGHSMGVQLIVKAYEMFPELFTKMILVNGFVSNPLTGLLDLAAVQKFIHYLKSLNEQYPNASQKIWSTALLNPLTIPITSLVGGFNLNLTKKKNIEIYTKGVSVVDFNVFISLFEDMLIWDGTPLLKTIKVPVLIISGNKDGVTPFKYQQIMKEQIPVSTLLKIPYGSHCSQLDFPEIVNMRSDQFIRSTTR